MTSLSKTIIRDMGFAKRNKEQAQESMLKKKKREEKRCIPKEGMSHALRACQKKRWRKRGKDSPCLKGKRKKREMVHDKELHPSSTKNIHTLAHLDQGV